MVFLFSLINISFTLFFFLFGQYIESILFWVISVVFIAYFSKILSFFIEKEVNDEENHKPSNSGELRKLPVKDVVNFLKKGSYYLSFLVFYTSLYGFIYGINLIYNFSLFSEIFHYISFLISFIITTIFFSLLQKKHETIFLIFRSNCIIFTIIYSFLLLILFIKGGIPTISFIINSLLPIATLLIVLSFDSFFKEKNKYIYGLFLFYLFLVGLYYASYFLPLLSMGDLLLGFVAFFMVVYSFVFIHIPKFLPFKNISKNTGMFMGYYTSLSIAFIILLRPLSFFYLCMLGITILYHYAAYKYFKNLISYIIFLLTFIFLYIKIFFLFWTPSFLIYLGFIFLLPYVFIGVSYFVYNKFLKEIYILHSIGIIFNISILLYYLIVTRDFGILSLSIIWFLESILLFISYVRLKK